MTMQNPMDSIPDDDPVQQQSTVPRSANPMDSIGDWHDVGRAAAAGVDYAKDLGTRMAGDIPGEVSKSLNTNLSGAAEGLGYIPKPTDNITDAVKEGLRVPYETGKGLVSAAAAIPDALYAPLKSIIGHPMADAERYTGKTIGKSLDYWFPGTKAGEFGKRMAGLAEAEEADPAKQREHYEQTSEGVTTALAAGRPKGFSPRGRVLGEPRPVPAMSTEQNFDTANNLYDSAHHSGVQVKPQSYFDQLDAIRRDLHAENYFDKKGGGKKAFTKLTEILESPETINQFGLTDIPRIHGDIKDVREMIRTTKSARSRDALRLVENGLVEFLQDLPKNPGAVQTKAGMPVDRAVGDLQRATGLWHIARKAESIDEVVRNAFSGARATGTGANIENKLRQGINSILSSKARRWGYQPDELALMRKIVDGDDNASQILRLLGKMAPSGVISAVGGLEIAHLLGAHGITKFVPGAIGIASKALAEARKAHQVDELSTFIRGKGVAGVTTRLPDYMAWKKRRIFDPRVMAPFLEQFKHTPPSIGNIGGTGTRDESEELDTQGTNYPGVFYP